MPYTEFRSSRSERPQPIEGISTVFIGIALGPWPSVAEFPYSQHGSGDSEVLGDLGH